eukprot:847493-Pelagomonas_calceolata.AAC.5
MGSIGGLAGSGGRECRGGLGGPLSQGPHLCFHSGSTSHGKSEFKIWGRNSGVCPDFQPNFGQA